MKITSVKAYVVNPNLGNSPFVKDDWQWTYVVIDTDEGISGWGESSNVPRKGSHLSAHGINIVEQVLIGQDPTDIERIWHTIYRHYTYLGSRGFPTTLLSGIDIALWDLKGKILNRPIYDLLGGKVRENVPLYANGWFDECITPDDYAKAARKVVNDGHDTIKLDPFLEMIPYHTTYIDGRISKKGENQGYDIVSAVRESVGDDIDILIDAHGNFDLPTSVRLSNRLYEDSNIGWFEEPLPPESFQALENFRNQTFSPVCVGERLFTRWDFQHVLENNLADYIMPDVTWTGGISEMRKIANLAELYYVPISPHNAQGAGQILAGAHIGMHVPNFYKLEHCIAFITGYNEFLKEPINFVGNTLIMPDGPGLGIDLDMDKLKSKIHEDWK